MRYHTTAAHRTTTILFLTAAALTVPLAEWRSRAADAALAPAPGTPKAIALVGALIRTQPDAGDFVGNLVIEVGKITAVRPKAPLPAARQPPETPQPHP